VNVTSGRSRSRSAGPTPRTRQSASILPNPPAESRAATIRAAIAGPIPGRLSMSDADARSMSSGVVAGFVAAVVSRVTVATFRERSGRCRVDESTRRSCDSSATLSASVGGAAAARYTRTPLPETAISARNQSALRSFCVDTRAVSRRGRARVASIDRAANGSSARGATSAAASARRRPRSADSSRSRNPSCRPTCGAGCAHRPRSNPRRHQSSSRCPRRR
jgi:hypothetical protein